jgi:pimeloyl-ACP methyl ester carboxylesterase
MTRALTLLSLRARAVKGEGSPLVMITGYSGNSEGWDNVVPRVKTLSEHQRVITLDNRGTGRSSRPEGEYSITAMADDVAGLLDELAVSRAHVLGVSMGGMIAQEVALRHSDKVMGLILVCTSPGGKRAWELPGQTEACEKLQWMYSPLEGLSPEAVMEELFRLSYYVPFFEANRDTLMSVTSEYPIPLETLRKQYDALLHHDTYDRLGEIRSKTLIVHGEDDILLLPEGARMLAERIPDSELLMLPEAGHSVCEEKWDEVYPRLRGFLGDLESSDL